MATCDDFDTSSWTELERDFNRDIQSRDAHAAGEAAEALDDLLALQGSDLTGLPPEPVAKALLGALRQHPREEYVQHYGCRALHQLCKNFAELRTALQRDPSVYATVRAAAKVWPFMEEYDEYSKELCVWLQPQQSEEQGRHQSGYAMTVSGAIPSGEGTRVAMFSARFDRGEMEMKFREVHKILLANNYNVLMVDVRSGENFGKLTTRYLNRVYQESGMLLAVCTPNYGEKTASAHSSHEELIFALDNKVQVLPLRVVDTYPPQPPFGPDHPYDKEGDAQGLVRRLFPPTTVFQDCRKKSEIQIAAEIAERLRAHSFSA